MPSFWTLNALSILLILCILSVQAALDEIVSSHQGLATRQQKVPNPFQIVGFTAGVNVVVLATSHASFIQRVKTTVLTGSKPGPAPCILQGNGEGFSSTGTGGPFINTPIVQATFTNVGTTTLGSVQTEDSTDNDLNDSVVTILGEAPPSSVAVPQAVNSASLESTLIESDLFFRPTDNITVSVHGFSGESTLSDFSASTQDWGKVTGEIIDINQEPIFPNLLVMRFLFSESTSDQPEMQNATLLLNGIVSFRGARPTGTLTSGVGWMSNLILGDLE
ncbi:hypothetical protein BDP27DRAFT_1367663 [Rhodocollybia butyracea]|uniref:Uncharacterized protein n=1 Tax=Rhodocollybia butyracea TaxID=206335 RepID=A0A9P5PHB6_9AGAR|nr:hypothetical protein BDP27DRAFT_1367663 [Rhodocollybia butyracea]